MTKWAPLPVPRHSGLVIRASLVIGGAFVIRHSRRGWPMFQYECPECGKKVELAQPAAPGKKLRCPVCQASFAPRAETIPLVEEPARAAKPAAQAAPAAARPAAAKPAAARPVAAKPARPNLVEDEEEDPRNPTPYGV